MVEQIIWSPLALKTDENIIDYLSEKFGVLAAQKLVQQMDYEIKLIASSTTICSYTYITSIHKKTPITCWYIPLTNTN